MCFGLFKCIKKYCKKLSIPREVIFDLYVNYFDIRFDLDLLVNIRFEYGEIFKCIKKYCKKLSMFREVIFDSYGNYFDIRFVLDLLLNFG